MALIGSDFITQTARRKTRCSECGRIIERFAQELVAMRFGKVQKRVCSEECRLRFDDRFWQEKAEERDHADD